VGASSIGVSWNSGAAPEAMASTLCELESGLHGAVHGRAPPRPPWQVVRVSSTLASKAGAPGELEPGRRGTARW
jgi:hypothetical protein